MRGPGGRLGPGALPEVVGRGGDRRSPGGRCRREGLHRVLTDGGWPPPLGKARSARAASPGATLLRAGSASSARPPGPAVHRLAPILRILELTDCPACGAQAFRGFELAPGRPLRRCDSAAERSRRSTTPTRQRCTSTGTCSVRPGRSDSTYGPLTFSATCSASLAGGCGCSSAPAAERRGRLLDVGSGTGEVLPAARDRGWQTQGVEPERTAAQMAPRAGWRSRSRSWSGRDCPSKASTSSAHSTCSSTARQPRVPAHVARWARPGGFVAVEVPNFRASSAAGCARGGRGCGHASTSSTSPPDAAADAFRAAGIEPSMVRSPAYVGPPQNLDQALWDLVRPSGRLRRCCAVLWRPGG